MRGEQLLSIVKNGELVKFNSRPCGRGDQPAPQGDGRADISIHAPAGGATQAAPFDARRDFYISIHAPAGGATKYYVQSWDCINFNSRPCGRGD